MRYLLWRFKYKWIEGYCRHTCMGCSYKDRCNGEMYDMYISELGVR